MNSKIIATGSYLPSKIVGNEDLEKVMDTNDAWIYQRTGIKKRRFEENSTSHMAYQAAKEATRTLDIEAIDCIIVATHTPDALIPSVASIVREKLGIQRSIPTFDLNAACTGFLYAYQNAHALIVSGMYECILVIGADRNSKHLNFEDRSTAILFGDGAGAVVLKKTDSGHTDILLGTEMDIDRVIALGYESLNNNPFVHDEKVGNSYFTMNGSKVFKFAVNHFVKSVKELLNRNNLLIEDIEMIISHQANQRILELGAKMLKIDIERVPSNIENIGNTSSASIPILLDELNKNKKLIRGSKYILVGFGGGLTWGSILVKW